MKDMSQNVWVLMLAGALGMSVAPMVVFIGGIVGSLLAPEPTLSTLPVAVMVVGTAVSVIPVARLMQVFGRKRVFVVSALLSALAALAAGYSIYLKAFWGFTLSVAFLGAGLAVVQQFRFAAIESVEPAHTGNAVSFVLLGGLIAAFLGPELAYFGEGLFEARFAGSFFLMAMVCMASACVLLFYKPATGRQTEHREGRGRPLSQIATQSVFWVAVMSSAVGYAFMSYIMTATPVSMHNVCGYSLEDTKWVIQSHIFAMFLPSFFSGRLVDRFGVFKLMWAGLVIYFVCMMVILSGIAVMHFWLGLVLLGIGWNFLFVAGTTLLPQSHSNSERFKVQGLNDFVVFGFQAIASLSSGVVIYSLGWDVLVILALPLLCVQIWMIWWWRSGSPASQWL